MVQSTIFTIIQSVVIRMFGGEKPAGRGFKRATRAVMGHDVGQARSPYWTDIDYMRDGYQRNARNNARSG